MSPIKGMSDRRRLPRVGKLHLGVMAAGQKGQYPKAVDYFVVHADKTTPDSAADAFREVYGEKPQELDVIFPTDDIEHWADPWYRSYSKSWGLVCKGDGETALAKWDSSLNKPTTLDLPGSWAEASTKEFQMQKIPCLAEECPMQKTKPPRCKAVMNLQFLLPNVRGIGVWQIDTGSWNSIRNIQSCIELIKGMTGGRVRGLWLKLRLTPKEVTPPDTKTKTVWVLDLLSPGITAEELLAEEAKLQQPFCTPWPQQWPLVIALPTPSPWTHPH